MEYRERRFFAPNRQKIDILGDTPQNSNAARTGSTSPFKSSRHTAVTRIQKCHA